VTECDRSAIEVLYRIPWETMYDRVVYGHPNSDGEESTYY